MPKGTELTKVRLESDRTPATVAPSSWLLHVNDVQFDELVPSSVLICTDWCCHKEGAAAPGQDATPIS